MFHNEEPIKDIYQLYDNICEIYNEKLVELESQSKVRDEGKQVDDSQPNIIDVDVEKRLRKELSEKGDDDTESVQSDENDDEQLYVTELVHIGQDDTIFIIVENSVKFLRDNQGDGSELFSQLIEEKNEDVWSQFTDQLVGDTNLKFEFDRKWGNLNIVSQNKEVFEKYVRSKFPKAEKFLTTPLDPIEIKNLFMDDLDDQLKILNTDFTDVRFDRKGNVDTFLRKYDPIFKSAKKKSQIDNKMHFIDAISMLGEISDSGTQNDKFVDLKVRIIKYLLVESDLTSVYDLIVKNMGSKNLIPGLTYLFNQETIAKLDRDRQQKIIPIRNKISFYEANFYETFNLKDVDEKYEFEVLYNYLKSKNDSNFELDEIISLYKYKSKLPEQLVIKVDHFVNKQLRLFPRLDQNCMKLNTCIQNQNQDAFESTKKLLCSQINAVIDFNSKFKEIFKSYSIKGYDDFCQKIEYYSKSLNSFNFKTSPKEVKKSEEFRLEISNFIKQIDEKTIEKNPDLNPASQFNSKRKNL